MRRASEARGELFGWGETGTVKIITGGSPGIHTPNSHSYPQAKKKGEKKEKKEKKIKEKNKKKRQKGTFSFFLLKGRKVASNKTMLSRK